MKAIWKQYKRVFIFFLLFGGLEAIYYAWILFIFPKPIFFTGWATLQVKYLLMGLGENISTYLYPGYPKIGVLKGAKEIITVFEGCNGSELFFLFTSFMLAFFKLEKKVIWFILLGLILIDITNTIRLGALYYISIYEPQSLYFFHKYFFNGLLIALVFSLWYYATKRF